ncbi:MAG TPA: hypothetical protein VL966_00445 [Alphaproteobacteria bacterium]|nr:hypothetical protein [Alphaproteobacteria bacterium]
MLAIRDMLHTLSTEIESTEELLLTARMHLGEITRNGCDGSDAQAVIAALEWKLIMLRHEAAALRRKMH